MVNLFSGEDVLMRPLIHLLLGIGTFLVTLIWQQPTRAGGSLAERVLSEFLAAEQSGEMQLLGNCLETFNLEQPQVERLIAAARETTSEERRNLLWHALRQTRSTAAREYLQLHLVDDGDHNSRVRFLRSLSNLSPFDVPLLTALYQRADKQALPKSNNTKQTPERPAHDVREDDLRDVLLQLATRETSALAATTPSWPEHYRDEKVAPPYMITARRTEQAKSAQAQLLCWLAQHAASEQHRLAAILPAYKVLDSGEQGEFSRGLLAAAKSPEERARLYPLLLRSYGVELVPRLLRDDLSETDKLGIFQALQEHGSTYGYSITAVQHGSETYEFVSKNDASPKVRAAAELLLKRLSGNSH
jgi:hypothetical protein